MIRETRGVDFARPQHGGRHIHELLARPVPPGAKCIGHHRPETGIFTSNKPP
jgi:hypothetical protein